MTLEATDNSPHTVSIDSLADDGACEIVDEAPLTCEATMTSSCANFNGLEVGSTVQVGPAGKIDLLFRCVYTCNAAAGPDTAITLTLDGTGSSSTPLTIQAAPTGRFL